MSATPDDDIAAWRDEIRKHREARERRLRAPDGWLALVERHVLEPGENELPIGTVTLGADGGVRVTVPPESTIARGRDGARVTEHVWAPGPVAADDVLIDGPRRWQLLRQGSFTALRARDPQSPALLAFRGLDCYEPDPRFRVVATLERADPPRTVGLAHQMGGVVPHACPGTLRFEIDGRPLALDPVIEPESPRTLFTIFADPTNRTETYGAGRFLYAPLPDDDGRVVLDFNKAFSPPCAFTPHASCPLPPPQNRLPVAIEAGEKRPHP